MRASLLANATASLFLCNRSDAVLSHAPKLYRAQLCGRIRSTFAAWINRVRRYLLPRLEMRPRIDRPPVKNGDCRAAGERRKAHPCPLWLPPRERRRPQRAGAAGGRERQPRARQVDAKPGAPSLGARVLALATGRTRQERTSLSPERLG
jgi:hypothetical protein